MKPNKYHSSGRLYTSGELADRRLASVPIYLVYGKWGLANEPRGRGETYINPTKRAIQAERAARPKGVSK